MAVEAVGAVVIKRVTDLLIQESNVFDNLIEEVEDIRLHLRSMCGFQDREANKWAEKYLEILFNLEDEVEKYVLGLTRRRRTYFIVFLEQQTGFFLHDCLRSGRALRFSLERIKKEISELEKPRHDQMVDLDDGDETESLSIKGGMNEDDAEETRSLISKGGMNEDDDGDKGSITSSVSNGIPSIEAGGTERDLRKITSFDKNFLGSPSSFSPRKHSRRIAIGQRKALSFPAHGKVLSSENAAGMPQIPGAALDRLSFWQSYHTVSNLKRDLGIVGFQKDIDSLVNRLKRTVTNSVIPVVGLPGSGKTTLVRSVYNHLDIKTHFGRNRVWVHLPDESHTSLTGIWMKMVQQIPKLKENGMSEPDQLKTKLIDFFKEEEKEKRKYLIVIDSLHSLNIWEKLSSGFPNLDRRESKVILITRDDTLASSISHNPHCLTGLNEDDSWKLFIEKLCPSNKDILNNHPSFRSEILKKCEHRPLNIVLLGRLLTTKGFGYDDWSWYLTQARWKKMDILSLCYNDLPPHSKLCLLYMSLFPAEVDVSVRRLHRLWLAEGFVRRSPGMTEEESVEECFDDLVERNLIKISKLKADESSRNCQLSSSIRDFLQPKAADISLYHIYRGRTSESHSSHDPNGLGSYESCSSHDSCGLGVRRIIEYADIRNYEPHSISADSSPFEHLRSYLSFNFQRNDIPAKHVRNFISKNIGKKGFGLLRVLDLEGVYKPTLPKSLKQLYYLRYLGLRWTFTDHLPDSVGELPYLETLDLKRTYINSLPSSIRKLERLRYLNLPNICLEHEEKRQLPSSFTELQTLLGLVIDEKTPVENDLDRLLKLRELGLTCQLNSSKSTLDLLPQLLPQLWNWIQKLTNLQSLWLRSKDEMGRPSRITLENLENLGKLSYMSLMGKLEYLVLENQFPPNLKVISLSVSQLNQDPMPILAKLPHLSVLRLLADSYLGDKMVCPKRGFSKLLVLKIWMLKKLDEWKVEEDGMPCIKELNIRHCPNLQQIPTELLIRSTLKEVTLTSMPRNIVEDVRNKKGQQVIMNVNNDYVFTELPWDSDSALWQAS